MERGFSVAHKATDGITGVRFAPHASPRQLLAVSSWDSTVSVLVCRDDSDAAHREACFTLSAPALCCEFDGPGYVLSGGAGAALVRADIERCHLDVVGRHDAPVSAVASLPGSHLLLSASWDASISLWDPRLDSSSRRVGHVALPGKCFSMSAGPSHTVVSTSDQQYSIFRNQDLERSKAEAAERRASKMKGQTRQVRCSPDGSGFAATSVEGKVSCEYFDARAKPFTFKCHREKHADGAVTVWPVNCLAFHPSMRTFASGGCDGTVQVWDPASQKRVHTYAKVPSTVASIDISPNGALLAVASSYTYERGEAGMGRAADEVYLHRIRDSEFRPRCAR